MEPHQSPLPGSATSLERYRHQRTVSDLYRRALPGPAFYALALVISQWIGGHLVAQALPVLGLLAAFGGLGWVRWRHIPPGEEATEADFQRWWSVHWGLIHTTCALWCIAFIAVGFQERYASTAFLVATVASITFTATACETYALSRGHAMLTVVLLQVPALVLFSMYLPDLHGVTIVLFFYMVYQALHIRRRADEYDKQILIEYTLITSRAEIDRLSREDSLTGLFNRREYEAAFASQWQLAQRQQGNLSLMVLDLDHFKHINDTYGHSVGDCCLKHVAEVLRQRVRRSSDMVARIGGEEFVVVLPDTSLDEARLLAQTLCEELAGTPAVCEGSSIVLTASIGVGSMQWNTDDSPQASFRRVDAACFAAKAQGRNRVVEA